MNTGRQVDSRALNTGIRADYQLNVRLDDKKMKYQAQYC